MLIDPVRVAAPPPPRRRRRGSVAVVAALLVGVVVGALAVVLVEHRSTISAGRGSLAPSSPGSSVSQRMPRGDLPPDADAPNGWKQVFADDFTGPDGPAGVDGSLPGGGWWGYLAGTPITNSTNGVYDASRVVSVSDGVLHFDLHSEAGKAYGAVEAPSLPAQTYGRYSVRYRYLPGSDVAGFKSVWMLWPDSNRWGDGEIDFNEYDNVADRSRMRAALLQACGYDTGCPQTGGSVRVDPDAWHVGTVVWAPGVVRAYVDGRLVAQSFQQVPSQPMHLLLQTEASDYGPTAAPDARVGIDVDWVTVYSRR